MLQPVRRIFHEQAEHAASAAPVPHDERHLPHSLQPGKKGCPLPLTGMPFSRTEKACPPLFRMVAEAPHGGPDLSKRKAPEGPALCRSPRPGKGRPGVSASRSRNMRPDAASA